MRSFFNSHLVALAGLFLALGLAYNVVVPIFEAPDERDHVAYADWLAAGNGIPHLVGNRDEVGEIWQPPLYYALVAAFIEPIDRSDLATIAPLSGDWRAGLSRVAHYHTSAEAFPFRNSSLAVHVARGVSTILGLITVLATYAIARLIIPTYALVAAALVALNPQFIFMSAAVNNDNLVIALCSMALWILVKLILGADTATSGRRQIFWLAILGLVWGLAALAKLTGLTLGLVIGLTLLYLARRRRSPRPLLLGGLVTGGTMLLVCGWWFWRNWALYGDPLAWNEMLAVTGGLVRPALLSWPETLRYATFLRKTYWAIFGYGVLAPDHFYRMVTGIMALALAGWAIRLVRPLKFGGTSTRFALLILATWSMTVLLFLLRWMRQIDATNQGRLLFPAIAGLGVLAAAGLAALDGRRMWLGKTTTAVLGCWAAALPILTVGPAYAQPPLVASGTIPNVIDLRFGEAIRLRGYELPRATVPGQPVEIALYWEATQPVDESYIVAVRLLDPQGRPATGLDSLPYEGRYSTVVWEPGQLFRDTYALPPISADAAPGLGIMLVILYPRGEPDAPLPVSAGGDVAANEARLGAIKISPAASVTSDPAQETGITFDNRFRLRGYDAPETVRPGEPVSIALYWEAIRPDGRDYTVFVHMLNDTGELVAQSDGPPQAGAYPTSIWSAGEQVVDSRILVPAADLMPGSYSILAGLYDPATGTRLPAFEISGARYPNDAAEIAVVRVN